ncbi:MAG TPA: M50 family metallopeptidase [Chloroflexota bacterium]|nr:M50 family metallopeptidase [Chloroflexota bacterium]
MAQAGEAAAAPASASGRSVWAQLADRVNPAYDRPRLRPDVVVRGFTTTDGEAYYIAKSPSAGTYVRLGPDEQYLLALMDGSHQVADLMEAYVQRYQRFAFDRVVHLVHELRQQRFLVGEPRDAWGGLAAALARHTWTYRIDQVIQSYRYHEFPLTGLDGPLTALYRAGGWAAFTPPVLLLGAVLALVGAGLFVWELLFGDRDILRFRGSYTLGLLTFLALWTAVISLHELGHALTTKHFGCEVRRGGVMLYYGLPAFFTDTSDIWMAPRRARLLVSVAGMATIWALGGLAMLVVVWQPSSLLAPIAFQLALVAYVNNTLQLVPLLELDGYYLLIDWLEMPRLRARALAFIRAELWRKLKRRTPFSREERIFTVYGTLALLYSGLVLAAATYLWARRLQRLLADAWVQEGVGWRVLVIVVALAFGIPLLFGTALKLWQLARAVGRLLARLRPPHPARRGAPGAPDHRPAPARASGPAIARRRCAGPG